MPEDDYADDIEGFDEFELESVGIGPGEERTVGTERAQQRPGRGGDEVR